MNKNGKEENILNNISRLAKYENPNNFEDYYTQIILKTSKKTFILFLF